MSNSVRPHRWQPTRLPHPWDSPGKNTGVGCHFLLQCMKVKSEREVAQSCPTLSNPMDCSLPGFSVHEIFQIGVLEWGAIAFSESLLMPGLLMTTARVWEMVLEVETFSCAVPHLQGDASAELSNKTFYNDENVLFCCCPIATNHI